jgi:hypothetical protein
MFWLVGHVDCAPGLHVKDFRVQRPVSETHAGLHHVEDFLSADTWPHLLQSISATVLSLYEVLGYPNRFVPDPLSHEKFESAHTHHRRMVGRIIDTCQLVVQLPDYKGQQLILILILSEWLTKTKFTLHQASELHGKLNDVTFANRWAQAYYFALQNTMRRSLNT